MHTFFFVLVVLAPSKRCRKTLTKLASQVMRTIVDAAKFIIKKWFE